MNNKRKNYSSNAVADNRGVALISVLVIMTVCLLVSTVVLEITYTSLLSRKVNKVSNDTFYSAETTLDDVQTVLQDVAVFTMKQMNTNSSLEFIDSAKTTLLASSGASSLNDTEKISEYIFDQLTSDTKAVLGQQDAASGAYVYDSSKFKISAVNQKNSSSNSTKSTLTFSVELNYIDPDTNYETRITTDLVMNDIVHRTPAAQYSLGSYSMFTGGGAGFSGNGDTTNGTYSCFIQEGNAYIGMNISNAPTAVEVSGSGLIFDGNRVIINGDVYVNDGALMFTGDKVTENGTQTLTEVDIKGTLYINKDAVVVLSDGVNLMCQDIVLVDGSNQWSVFESGKPSYINKEGYGIYKCLYPYEEATPDALKGKSEAKYISDWGSKKTSGCILGYNKDEGTTSVLEYNSSNGKWTYTTESGTKANFGGLINHSKYFMPEALATVYTYDGGVYQVDPEMCNFVNMDVLYWQYKNGNGGVIDMNTGAKSVRSILSSGGTVERGTVTLSNGYTFNDVGLYSGFTTQNLIDNYSSLTTYKSGSISENNTFGSLIKGYKVLGKEVQGITLMVGSNGGAVQNGSSASDNMIVLTNRWNDYNLQVSAGNFIGINISADKVNYTALGKGVTTSYSILGAKQDGDNLQEIIDSVKYLSFIRNAYLGNAGNGSEWYNLLGADYDKFYSLGTIDSLFVGGLDAFFADDDETKASGGTVSVDSSVSYNFITIENWQTN